MTFNRLITVLIFCLILGVTAKAQEFIGISTSSYSGIMGLELQPANHADNRLAYDVRIGGLNFAFGNNLLGFNPKYLGREGGLT
ncbi:MAG: hypothetical protein ACKOW8_09640, partial [Flavobacteriales bacterium]